MSLKFQKFITQDPVKAAMQEVYQNSAIKNLLAQCQTGFDRNRLLSSWAKLVVKKSASSGAMTSKKDFSSMHHQLEKQLNRNNVTDPLSLVLMYNSVYVFEVSYNFNR